MNTEDSTVDIRQYLAVAQRWWWLVVLATLLAAGSAFASSKLSTPVYEASTTLLINEGQKATGQDYNSILMSERLAKTYAQLLTGRSVLQEVAVRYGLPATPEGLKTLAGALTVEPVRDTQLIRLKVRQADPELAARIANGLPEVFAAQNEAMQAARYDGPKENLLAQMATLQDEIDAAQAELDAAKARSTFDTAEVGRLEALLSQYRATYAGLLQSYEEIRVAEAKAMDSIIVTETAIVPTDPVLPRTLTNTALAGVVGAMLAVGAVFLIEYLDDTVKTPEDVERGAHLVTLAHVMQFPHFAGNGRGPLIIHEPQSAVAENYRVLRTNLEFGTLSRREGAVAVLVTSAEPQEGKSTTLVNLGVSLAQAGKQVIIVDTDLRRPTLHRQFHLPNSAGVTSFLLERQQAVERFLQETAVPGLRVLPSGPIPANPADILGFPETAAVIEELRGLADYVLLDTPPVLSAADAGILAQRVDGVVLVVAAGQTRSDVFRRAVGALQQVKAHVLGCVLNKVVARPGEYYYRHYDYYGGDKDKTVPQLGESRRSRLLRRARGASAQSSKEERHG